MKPNRETPVLRQPRRRNAQPIAVNSPHHLRGGRARIFSIALAAAFFWLMMSQTLAQNAPAEKAVNQKDGTASRGEYIVNNVAVCSQCHTPRDSAGRLERSHWLEGASVWLQSAEPVGNWPQQAPRIAGAMPGTDDEMITLLTTGIWRTGTYLRPLMPQFRLSRQDAEAVVAYLKSVKPASK